MGVLSSPVFWAIVILLYLGSFLVNRLSNIPVPLLDSHDPPDSGDPMRTNEELLADAQSVEVESTETQEIVTEVVAAWGTRSTELQDAKDALADSRLREMPSDLRDTISLALTNSKTTFDGSQDLLRALVSPPTPDAAAKRAKRGK